MTGGGGGGYYVPPVRKRVTVSCEMLVVVTVLTHPNEELLATLEVGQILTVHVQEERVYVMYGDQIAGYVEAPENSRIIVLRQELSTWQKFWNWREQYAM